jgi:hypothetical protein
VASPKWKKRQILTGLHFKFAFFIFLFPNGLLNQRSASFHSINNIYSVRSVLKNAIGIANKKLFQWKLQKKTTTLAYCDRYSLSTPRVPNTQNSRFADLCSKFTLYSFTGLPQPSKTYKWYIIFPNVSTVFETH